MPVGISFITSRPGRAADRHPEGGGELAAGVHACLRLDPDRLAGASENHLGRHVHRGGKRARPAEPARRQRHPLPAAAVRVPLVAEDAEGRGVVMSGKDNNLKSGDALEVNLE